MHSVAAPLLNPPASQSAPLDVAQPSRMPAGDLRFGTLIRQQVLTSEESPSQPLSTTRRTEMDFIPTPPTSPREPPPPKRWRGSFRRCFQPALPTAHPKSQIFPGMQIRRHGSVRIPAAPTLLGLNRMRRRSDPPPRPVVRMVHRLLQDLPTMRCRRGSSM